MFSTPHSVTVSDFVIPPSGHCCQLVIDDLSTLAQWSALIAPQLKPGDVLALKGDMGAGKTTWVKHLGKALGITERINSPTFVLVHDYHSGRLPVVHVDFYRLGQTGADTLAEELRDMLQGKQALLIAEWAEYADFLQPFVTYEVCLFAPEADPDCQHREVTWITR